MEMINKMSINRISQNLLIDRCH